MLSNGVLNANNNDLESPIINWSAGEIHNPGVIDLGGAVLVQNGGRFQRDLGNGHTHIKGAYSMRNDSVGFLTAGEMTVDEQFEVGSQSGSDATFTQRNSSVLNVENQLRIGRSAGGQGTYNLSAGTVNANGGAIIGFDGTGTFNHSGGNVNVNGTLAVGLNSTAESRYEQFAGPTTVTGQVEIGGSSIASGRYILNGGVLDANTAGTAANGEAIVVGNDGTGSFNHNNGTVRVNNGDLVLARTATGRGFYHLDGGTLDMQNNGIRVGAGTQFQFNLNAGGLRNPGTIKFDLIQDGGTLNRDGLGTTTIQGYYSMVGGTAQVIKGLIEVEGTIEIGKGVGSNSSFLVANTGNLDVGTDGASSSFLQVGVQGTGTVNHTHGTVRLLGGHMILGGSGSGGVGTGVYNLSGDDAVLDVNGRNIVHGAGSATFNFTAGRLQNAATIDLGGALVQSGGTLAPGNSPGLTTINGGYTLDSGTLEIELDGSTSGGFDYDLVEVINGGVDLIGADTLANADLQIILGFAPELDESFTVLTNDGTDAIAGTFAQGSAIVADYNGQTYGFDISYTGGTGNDVTLTVTSVPEPTSLALLGVGGLALVRRRRGC